MESISIIVSYLSLLVTLLYPYTYHRIPTPPRIWTPSREGMGSRGPVGIYRVLEVDVDTSRTCIPLYPPHTVPSPAGDHSTGIVFPGRPPLVYTPVLVGILWEVSPRAGTIHRGCPVLGKV